MASMRGKTVFISGASRGIGLAIGKKLASQGANITIAAKTTVENPKIPGTIYSAAAAIEQAGGKALPLVCDIRSEEDVDKAFSTTVERFGGLDILINNASAISLTNSQETPMKRYDLMNSINTRGTYMCSKYAIPYLRDSARAGRNPHILNLSPPLHLEERWFAEHTAYSIAKYGMSLCVLGLAGELRSSAIAVNALWPLTVIHTAALNMLGGAQKFNGRKPEIMADAADGILKMPSDSYTGKFLVDEIFLRQEMGVRDLRKYAYTAGTPDEELSEDFFNGMQVWDEVHRLRNLAAKSTL